MYIWRAPYRCSESRQEGCRLHAHLQLWYLLKALVIVSVPPVQPAAARGMQRHPDVHWIFPLQATDKKLSAAAFVTFNSAWQLIQQQWQRIRKRTGWHAGQ